MKVRILAAVLLLVSAVVFSSRTVAPAQERPSPADTIVVHARIYTVNSHQPWAEALAIRDAKIVAAGSGKEIDAYRGPGTRVIDAGGRLVLPGIVDTHVHFMGGAIGLQQIHLDDATTVAEIQKLVKAYAAAHPDAPWILGRGWWYSVFGSAALPDRKMLDDVVSDRPVFLTAYDGHSTWANSKALQMAGITRDTADPTNGIIVRDPKTGEPTGALKEAAGRLVRRIIPEPSRQDRLEALRQAMHYANSLGVVRVHIAGSDWPYLDIYNELRQKGALTVRFYCADGAEPPDLTPDAVDRMEQNRRKYHDEWLDAGAVKFFLDGVIEAHTAAMLAPYTDDPSQSGHPNWDPVKYKQAVAELDRRGFQLFTHAIGDRAIRLALDAYQEANKANGHKDARDRVEHIEDPSAVDIPRFGKLGVIASMQPLHAYPNDNILNVWARNVGPERALRAWPWHDIAAAGGRLAFGSDWAVVTLNPWGGFQILLTRQTTEGNPPGGWNPNERITLEQAVEGYTLSAAFAGRREKTEGSLEPGKLADLIIVSQDLFHTEPGRFGKTEALLTMVGGKIVYESPAWKSQSPPPEKK
jgi:predicted amidohydrolase YtcJ